jgi:hypothetical protein
LRSDLLTDGPSGLVWLVRVHVAMQPEARRGKAV